MILQKPIDFFKVHCIECGETTRRRFGFCGRSRKEWTTQKSSRFGDLSSLKSPTKTEMRNANFAFGVEQNRRDFISTPVNSVFQLSVFPSERFTLLGKFGSQWIITCVSESINPYMCLTGQHSRQQNMDGCIDQSDG